MSIGDREKVTVFESAKMWNCNPSVLILFVRIAWRLTCLCGKSKLGDAVSVHLFWITGVISILNVYKLALRQRMLNLLTVQNTWWNFLRLRSCIWRQYQRSLWIVCVWVALSLFEFVVPQGRICLVHNIRKFSYSSFCWQLILKKNLVDIRFRSLT